MDTQAQTIDTEKNLMAAYVRDEDPGAFHELFKILGPRVHRFFLRKFGDESVADDMNQITFMKMHRARKDYRIGEPVRPWLFTIAARVRIDELRRRRRHREFADDRELNRAASKAVMDRAHEPDSLERADVAEKVRSALNSLPESQRKVVWMHRYEGLTFKEVAGRIDATEGAVKLRAFRAYGQLRRKLSPLLARDGTREAAA